MLLQIAAGNARTRKKMATLDYLNMAASRIGGHGKAVV
jgi:hypothetical protein